MKSYLKGFIMDKQLDAKITAFLEENRENIFSDIDSLLRIESVNGEPEEGAPLGRNVKLALDRILEICASHGLTTRNIDGMVGEAVWGQGEQSLGILAHVDIVPVGAGWTKPPLQLTVENGMMYGRGVTDDKGPAISSLWALLAALAAGVKINRRIVFLFGGDEEIGMRCLRRYLETETPPDMAFSPDAEFPVIFCEKTIAHGTLSATVPEGSALIAMHGGTRVNVVPDGASACLSRIQGAPPMDGISVEQNGEGYIVRAVGTAAHGSTPSKGDNAIMKLLGALTTLLPAGDAALPVIQALHTRCSPTDGSGFGIACEDEVSGKLTFNLGVIDFEGGSIAAQFDIRHPVEADEQKNLNTLLPCAAAASGLAVSFSEVKKGFNIGRDHVLVRTLMGIYNEINNSSDEPLAIGGGTYARMLPCAVAYGMLFAGDPETAHMADERIGAESFMKATRIYAHAIAELGK